MGRVSAASILRQLIELGVIPGDAAISSRGVATWHQGHLECVTWLDKDLSGSVMASMNVGDAKLGPAMDDFGRMAVRLRLRRPSIAWPERKVLKDEEADYFRNVITAERDFLKGRRDLIDVLASESEVVRGDVYAWQDKGSHVARRVQALILAEDMGELALANSLRESLRTNTKQLPGDLSGLVQARRWADDYAKRLNRRIVI